jgi:glycosyltransferase involved in cell wall biosynthesis
MNQVRVVMLSKAVVVGTYQRKLEEIAQLGIALTVLVPPSWRDSSGELPLERTYTNGYDLQVIPIQFNGNYHLHRYPTLPHCLDRIQPNLLHIDEEPYNLATWEALWYAKRRGIKTLFFSWQNLVRAYPPPFSWGERWTLDTIDHALMGTQSAADVWRAKGYRKPYTVIPQFGIDPDLFKPSLKREERPFTIGFAGRLVPEKGVDVLLNAVKGLSGDFQVKIAGQGNERTALESLTKDLGLREKTEFLGQMPSTQLPHFYHGLDVLVIPSVSRPNWKEQFGRVIIEANGCGVPVIGSDCGAIPGLVGYGGLIFPEGDSVRLQEILTDLMRNPERRYALGQAGREQVLRLYTHQGVARQTVAVYQSLL